MARILRLWLKFGYSYRRLKNTSFNSRKRDKIAILNIEANAISKIGF